MSSNAVEVVDIEKSYGETKALDGISFSIRQGEVFGLLGPNGAGKTTTVNILSTYLEPDAGHVTVCGHDLIKDRKKVQSVIGVVPQEVALYPYLTALENLVFWGRIHSLPDKTVKEKARELLEWVDLWDRRNDFVNKLSGGMKRRLNLAAGLLNDPRLLILDEPTVGIDVQTRRQIYNLAAELKSRGVSLLYTSHYLEEAERLCDRVAIIDKGAVLTIGSMEEVLSSRKDPGAGGSRLEDLFIELTGSEIRY